MSYQERRTIVNILSGLIITVAYCIYAFGRYQSGAVGANDLKFWAGTMLIFIGIGIVAIIILQIVFHILMSISIAVSKKIQNQECGDDDIEKSIHLEFVEDEMHKLIELKSMQVGFVVAGIGFVTALVTLLFGYSAAVMLNILFLSFNLGSILEGVTQIYFYRRGIAHG